MLRLTLIMMLTVALGSKFLCEQPSGSDPVFSRHHRFEDFCNLCCFAPQQQWSNYHIMKYKYIDRSIYLSIRLFDICCSFCSNLMEWWWTVNCSGIQTTVLDATSWRTIGKTNNYVEQWWLHSCWFGACPSCVNNSTIYYFWVISKLTVWFYQL